MTLKIKNWAKHQHFKDRTPPWIKLYRDILDDPDWHELDGDSAKVLVGLWLLASEDESKDGTLPDVRRIAFRLRIKESQVIQAISKLPHWLIQDEESLASERYHSDAPETEAETLQRQRTETDEREEREKPRRGGKRPACNAESMALADGVNPDHLRDWIKARRSALTETAWRGVKEEAQKAGISAAEAVRICAVKGWRGFNASWNWNGSVSQSQAIISTEQRDAEAMRLLGFGQSEVFDA